MGKKSNKNKIPDLVPLIIIESGSAVIFPSEVFIKLRVVLASTNAGNSFADDLKNSPYAIVVPLITGDSFSEVGVLGKLKQVRKSKKNILTLSFKGLKRVTFDVNRNRSEETQVFFCRWQERRDFELSLSEIEEIEFQADCETFVFLFDEFNRKFDLYKKMRDLEHFQSAVELIQNLDTETVSAAIDAVMNILNQTQITSEGHTVNLVIPSYIILKEQNIYRRLELVVQLMDELLYAIPQDQDYPEHSGLGSENEKTHDSNGHEDKKNIELWNQGAIEFMRQDLLKPRKITSVAETKKIPNVPHGRLIALDRKKQSKFMGEVMKFLGQYVVNQERAKEHVADILVKIKHKRFDPRRPIVGGFFAGPTGVGKTELIHALSKFLFDDFSGYTHISCNLLQERHQASHLIGSPPGYIGHDAEPILSQWRIDRPHFVKHMREIHKVEIGNMQKKIEELQENYLRSTNETERRKIRGQITKADKKMRQFLGQKEYRTGKYWSVILFDEIERADPAIYNQLLQILDDGRLQLMNGDVTDFRRSIFWFTSNIYGHEIQKAISGGQIGIRSPGTDVSTRERFEQKTWKEVLRAVEKHFLANTAFFGRIGKERVVVFYPLGEDNLYQILERMYLSDFIRYLQNEAGIGEFYLTDAVKHKIIQETQDPVNRALGARALRRVFERLVENPIIRLLELGEEGEEGIVPGDRVWMNVAKTEKNPEGEIVIQKEK